MGALENLVGGVPQGYASTGSRGVRTGGTLERFVSSVTSTPITKTAQTIGQIPPVQQKPKQKSLWDYFTDFGNLYKQASETASHALFGNADDLKRLNEVNLLVQKVKTTGKPPAPKQVGIDSQQAPPSATLKDYKPPSKEFSAVLDTAMHYGRLVSGESMRGLTGGFISPEYEAPKNLSEKVVASIANVGGSVASLSAIGEVFGAISAGVPMVSKILSAYPRVAKYVFPFIKNAAAFDVYGQLNPDLKNRFQSLAMDTITSIPYTALGYVGKARFSVPASMALGYGMTKLEGGSDEDAIINGVLLGVLDGVGRLGGKGKEFINGRIADRELRAEAINILNKYAETKINAKSSPEEIARAYKEAAKNTHPDLGGSEKAMKSVNSAYEFLSGKVKEFIKPEKNGEQPEAQKVAGELEAQSAADAEAARSIIRQPKEYASTTEKINFENLMKDPVKYREEYLKQNGNVINTDSAYTLFDGYTGDNVVSFVKPASAVRDLAFYKLIEQNKGQGNNTVVFTGGAPGSGKTTALQNMTKPGQLEEYPVVVDSTLANKDMPIKIGDALKAGYNVEVVYTLRDPVVAWENGVLPRVQEEGRIVTEQYFLDTFEKSLRQINELVEKYKNDKRVRFGAVENNGGEGDVKALDIEKLKDYKYNSDEVSHKIHDITERFYKEKKLSEQQYKATISDRPAAHNGRTEKRNPEKTAAGTDLKSSITPEIQKKLSESYSASSIAEKGKIKQPVEINGRQYVQVGSYEQGDKVLDINVAEVVPAEEYKGKTFTYGNAPKGGDSIYNGMEVRRGGKKYVLTNAQKISLGETEKAIADKKEPEKRKLTMRPTSADNPEKIAEEIKKLGLPEEVIEKMIYRPGKSDLPSGYKVPKIRKADFVTIVRNSKTFKANPVMIVDEDKNLTFTSKDFNFSIPPEDLQLKRDALLPGDEITVDIKSLKGTAQQMRVYSGSSAIASTGAAPLGVYEKGEKTEVKNFKIFEKVKGLIEKYAATVGEGYLPRGALGVYYSGTTNIRVNGMNNLSVAAHEITHFLDFHYKISEALMGISGHAKNGNPIYESGAKNLRKEITDVYTRYYPGGSAKHSLRKRTLEGYATLLQKYIEMPKQMAAEFPDLVKEFLTPEGKYYKPVIGEILKDLKGIVAEYQSLPALDKVGARIANSLTPTKQKEFLTIWDKIRTTVEDEIWPIEKIAVKTGTHFTGEDPSIWLRSYQNAAGVYANNIRNARTGYYGMNEKGEFVKLHDFNWKTLVDHLHKEKTVDSFGNYLVARDQYFQWKDLDRLKKVYDDLLAEYQAAGGTPDIIDANTGKPLIALVRAARKPYQEQLQYLRKNGFTRDEIDAAYTETKKDKRFDKEEEMYDVLVAEDLKLLNHPLVQLIKPDVYQKLKQKEGYASMKRQVYDDITGEEKPVMNQPGKTKVGSLKHRTGGERQIINPVLNGMTNHIEIIRKSMKQAIYNRFGDLAVKGKLPDLFQRTELKPLVDAATGVISYPQERDPHIIMTRVNYKRVPVLTDTGIKKVIDETLTYQTMNIFEHLLVTASRIFTTGTTGLYPQFALTNFTADQWNAIYNTRNGYTPIIDQIRLLSSAIKQKGGKVAEYYEEWEVLGGDRMTLVQSQLGSMDQAQKYLQEESSRIRKALELVNRGIDIFGTPSKISETVSRFAEYYKAREAGKHQLVALEEAGRITAPFHHIGSWKIGDRLSGKYIVRTIPFANASFQVLGQTIKTAEQNPAARKKLLFIMLSLLTLSLGSLASVMLFGSKSQKEQYKDLDPVDIATYLHYPAFGGNGMYRIKMSPEMTTIAAVATMVMAQNLLGVRYRAEDYKNVLTNWAPKQMNILSLKEMFLSWMNPLIKIPFELIANIKDYPSIRPLENQSMQNTEPRYRYNEYTSGLAKLIGDKFNLSPVKIDFLMEGLGSRSVRFVSAKPGAYNPFSSGYREYYLTMGRRLENYYDDRTKDDQRYKALRDKLKAGTVTAQEREEGRKLKNKMTIYNTMDDYLKYYRKIDEKKEPAKASFYREKIIRGLEILNEK